MGTMMVALRWDGAKLSRDQLVELAQSAVAVVQARFDQLDQLNIQAIELPPIGWTGMTSK